MSDSAGTIGGAVNAASTPEPAVGSERWKRVAQGPYQRLDRNPDALELARLALCALTIVPVRMILIALFLSLYYIIARCFLALAPDRPWAQDVNILFVRWSSWLLLRLLGFWRVDVKGLRENAGRKREPRIFVSNHISYVEILYFLAELGPSFVMKRTCTRVPLIGSIAVRVVDSVSVDNKGGKEGGSGSQAISSRLVRMFGEEALVSGETESPGKDQKAVAAERWARGWRGNPLLLFPEGTTSNGSCLLRFKTGVFAGGLPVHPVTVQYDSQRFSPAFESIYAWVHIFRMLAEPAHHLRVEYLPRYCPTPEQRADRALYAKAVQGVFCKAMGLPAVDTGYAEKTTYHKYLRKSFQTHPWGAAAVLLPAPDLHSALLAKAPGHSCNERTSWVQKEGPNSDGSGGGMVEGGENDIVTAASSTERSIDSAVGVAGTGGSADKGEGRLRRRNGERAVH